MPQRPNLFLIVIKKRKMTLPRMHQPSYPTRCLDFLSNIDRDESVKNGYPPSTNGNIAVQPAALTLKVIVVGAGLGGLATSIALARRGHSVTVLEQAPELGEVKIYKPTAMESRLRDSLGWRGNSDTTKLESPPT